MRLVLKPDKPLDGSQVVLGVQAETDLYGDCGFGFGRVEVSV